MNEWSTKLTSKAWSYFGTKIHSYINQELFINSFLLVSVDRGTYQEAKLAY